MHPVILLPLSSVTTDWVWLLIFTRFLGHTQWRTTVGGTPLNEWSVRRKDLYLTTHNNHNRQISMPPDVPKIFYLPLKIRRLRPGLNPLTWIPNKGQHATSRPPKPLIRIINKPLLLHLVGCLCYLYFLRFTFGDVFAVCYERDGNWSFNTAV